MFLAWHYTEGLIFYSKRFLFALRSVNNYFSVPILLVSLFSPWKRMIIIDSTPGFNFSKYFQKLSFNFISRFIGAIVRIALIFAGLILLILTFIFGGLGFFLWIIFPPLSLPIYLKISKSSEKLTASIIKKIQSGENLFEALFKNDAGRFVLAHIGFDISQISAGNPADFKITAAPKSYQELIKIALEANVWDASFLRSHSLSASDFLLAASWWDKKRTEETKIEKAPSFGRLGIGSELLYGYTPSLNQYVVDLGLTQRFAQHLIGRQDVVLRMERVLSSGNNIILVGPPGVGKKTVLYEFAQRAKRGELGMKLAYKRVLEFDYNFLFSQSTDLNQKKTRLSEILSEASAAGNIILVVRDFHRIINSSVEGLDFTDILEGYLEKKNIKIIVISSNIDYERFISQNLRIRKYFDTVTVVQPTREEAMEILLESAQTWENKKNLTITVPALREILTGSDRFITEIPFPEKALELLDAAVSLLEQKSQETLTADIARSVISERTGISLSALTQSEKTKLSKLEEIIHQNLINQEAAVTLIAQILRSKTSGVTKTNKPIGSFLFLGPTGVGKTETAKVLAEVYFGAKDQILRFDMAEYAGSEGLQRLIGSAQKETPGALTTAIKNHPASLLLLDEIEKAPPEVFNLFLALLDEGMITDAFDRKVNCQHLFIVATSNAGASFIRDLVLQNIAKDKLQKEVVNYVIKSNIFSPEFINRFDGVVVYEPLSEDHLLEIARLQLKILSQSLIEKDIILEFDEEAIKKIAREGYDPAFGARPMKRIIEIYLGDLIGKAVLEGQIGPGDKIRVLAGSGKNEFKYQKLNS